MKIYKFLLKETAFVSIRLKDLKGDSSTKFRFSHRLVLF